MFIDLGETGREAGTKQEEEGEGREREKERERERERKRDERKPWFGCLLDAPQWGIKPKI